MEGQEGPLICTYVWHHFFQAPFSKHILQFVILHVPYTTQNRWQQLKVTTPYKHIIKQLQRNCATYSLFVVHYCTYYLVSNIFYVCPENWGNDPIRLTHIFPMGWFNHQLAMSSVSCHFYERCSLNGSREFGHSDRIFGPPRQQ